LSPAGAFTREKLSDGSHKLGAKGAHRADRFKAEILPGGPATCSFPLGFRRDDHAQAGDSRSSPLKVNGNFRVLTPHRFLICCQKFKK
jgi:hypothetical protein